MANDRRIVNDAERSQNDLDRLDSETSETSELEVSDKSLGRPAGEELVDLDTDAEFCREVDDEATPRTIRSTIKRRQIDTE